VFIRRFSAIVNSRVRAGDACIALDGEVQIAHPIVGVCVALGKGFTI